jgi:ferredoxin-NADP reductase
MAVPKSARLLVAENVAARSRRLTFEMTDPAELGFIGGQYIIIDSGLTLPNGKAAKRAYSIASSDSDQTRFDLVARRIDGGICSNYLHELEVGATLKFSGPWGKFLPVALDVDAQLERTSAPAVPRSTWVVATDTGITAALGLVAGRAFRERRAQTTLLWLSAGADDFVSRDFVRDRLAALDVSGGLGEVRWGDLPPVNHPERVAAGLVHFEALRRTPPPERVYLAGDGALLYPFAQALALAGLAESQVAIESFFNVPVKKVGISAGGDAK